MGDCKVRVQTVWECPICARQTVTLEGEQGGPYVCDGIDLPHRQVEMEQRLPASFKASRQ